MAQLLVRAGQVVLPTGTIEADVLVEREKIRAVASNVTDTGSVSQGYTVANGLLFTTIITEGGLMSAAVFLMNVEAKDRSLEEVSGV